MINTTIDTVINTDIKICQPKDNGFRFGSDSVLLAHFTKAKRKWNILDIGAGSGIITILISKLYGSKMTAIELQPEMYYCLLKSIKLSKLEDNIKPINLNIKDFKPHHKYDAIVCNPPYRKIGKGKISYNKIKQIAKFTIELDLNILLTFCKAHTKTGGKLFFSYDADMFVEAITICKQNLFEPKRIQFIHPDQYKPAKLVLIESIYCAGEEALIEPPLFQKDCYLYEKIFKDSWTIK